MFARVTTYELAEGRASESISVFEPAVDSVSELDGFVDGWFLVERDGLHAVDDDGLGEPRRDGAESRDRRARARPRQRGTSVPK